VNSRDLSNAFASFLSNFSLYDYIENKKCLFQLSIYLFFPFPIFFIKKNSEWRVVSLFYFYPCLLFYSFSIFSLILSIRIHHNQYSGGRKNERHGFSALSNDVLLLMYLYMCVCFMFLFFLLNITKMEESC
jgi:hypothetical protein